MIILTLLEEQVLQQMIFQEVRNIDQASLFVKTIRLDSRTFSPDSVDVQKCAGFFLNISNWEFLKDLREKSQLSMQASHPNLSIGADFILFVESPEGPFLEASFYGESLPIEVLLSRNHGFTFEAK